jgi:hypothetical protein
MLKTGDPNAGELNLILKLAAGASGRPTGSALM